MSKKRLFQTLALVTLCLIIIVISNPIEISSVQAAPEPVKQSETPAGELSSRSAASLTPTSALTATAPLTEPVLITVWEEAPGEIHTLAGSETDEAVSVETVREDNMVPFEPPPPEAEDIVVVEGDPPDDAAETVNEDDMVPAGPDAAPVETTVDPYQHWELLLTETFEGDFPAASCALYRREDTTLAFWGPDAHRHYHGEKAGWPARRGPGAGRPPFTTYPTNLYTTLRCGPYDRSQAQTMMVQYERWVDRPDPEDRGGFGYSFDGMEFTYYNWPALRAWRPVQFRLELLDRPGQIWFSWRFTSDEDKHKGEGVWIDDLKIWRYKRPVLACGELDPGRTGIVVEPYHWVANAEYPIIRPGYHDALEALVDVNVKWVRLGFRTQDPEDELVKGEVRLRHYDYMVDALCARGISVLGLVNHQTLTRQDSNDEATAADYRTDFTGQVEFLARHFRGRINDWEIWNEPDYELDLTDKPDPPLVRPDLYATLLVETAATIRAVNPNAKILSGGLANAWDDSYLDQVYQALDDLGETRPFDYLAVHPYFDDKHGLDPGYLLEHSPTLLAKFTQKMAGNRDGHKPIWVTEIGWNSAFGEPPDCWPHRVTEQQQAEYLKRSFDILFSQVRLADNSACPAVSHTFWYQFLDTRIPAESICIPDKGQEGQEGAKARGLVSGSRGLVSSAQAGVNSVAWHFGIDRFNAANKIEPKPAHCAFARYPEPCQPPPPLPPLPYSHYLPLVMRSPNPWCPK